LAEGGSSVPGLDDMVDQRRHVVTGQGVVSRSWSGLIPETITAAFS
jgi:hypothetical protein